MQKFGRVNQKKNRYSLLFEIMSQVIKRKNTHRIFLGIFPQKEHISFFRDILRNLDEEKRNLKHIPLDMVHLTLYFIGANVSESSLQKIIKLFESKKDLFTKPTINITGVNFGFEYQNNPRVILVNVEANESLKTLWKEVYSCLKELKLRDTIRWKEKRANDFHISLSRLKTQASKSVGKRVAKITQNLKTEYPLPFTAENFYIIESTLTSEGPVYKKIKKI